MFPVASVCLSVCNALSFKSLDLERSFVVSGISSDYLGASRISRLSDQGQDHGSNKACLSIMFVGGLPLIERQSCSFYASTAYTGVGGIQQSSCPYVCLSVREFVSPFFTFPSHE